MVGPLVCLICAISPSDPDRPAHLAPELGEPDGRGFLLHHHHGIDRVGDLFEIDIAVVPDVVHLHKDVFALLVRGACIALVDEPLHPVVQLYECARSSRIPAHGRYRSSPPRHLQGRRRGTCGIRRYHLLTLFHRFSCILIILARIHARFYIELGVWTLFT